MQETSVQLSIGTTPHETDSKQEQEVKRSADNQRYRDYLGSNAGAANEEEYKVANDFLS